MTPYLLSHLIDSAAERDPAHTALKIGDQAMSYGELAARSAKLAAAIGETRLSSGQPIGVYAFKALDTVVAIHAIQRAGAITVPIDPMAPPAQVSRMTSSLGLRGLVVDDAHASRIAGTQHPPVIITNAVTDGIDAEIVTSADIEASQPVSAASILADDPAYMITTSGSTGEPKAIVHTHRSAMRYAQLAAATYALRSDDRLANVAPFHFDQSTFELYASLVARATSVMVPEAFLRFPAELSKLAESERLTVWYSVPTILTQLLHRGALDDHDLSSLRWVLFGGERFGAGTLGQLMRRLPTARFSNVYGPAEVNQCTHHHLTRPPEADQSIPIGAPWADTEVRVVEPNSRTLPKIELDRGELVVRSATMMAGYWNRQDLTEGSMLAEHDSSGIRRRWYRTGDLVERDDNGLLHFLGRVDRQVKVRGARVELEYVESALADVDGVISAAAVTVMKNSEQQLIAVLETDGSVAPRTVMAAVRDVLPPHAVPSDVVIVDRLPRTQSGKIDSRAAADAYLEQVDQ